MANNYLQFSAAIMNLSAAERESLERQLETVYVFNGREYTDNDVPADVSPEDATWSGCRALRDYPDAEGDSNTDFECEFCTDDEQGSYLWLFAEEGGDPLHVAHLVQKFLREFRPGECWSLTYSEICDKPRLGEFSGGAVFVTAEAIESLNAHDFVFERQAAFEGRRAANEPKQAVSALMG